MLPLIQVIKDENLKKKFLRLLIFSSIAAFLIAGYSRLSFYFQAPFRWVRQGDTYTNIYYGFQVKKREDWLRHLPKDSLGRRIYLSRLFGSPVPLLFPKQNLIEFHKLGESQKPDAIVSIGPVDELKGKPNAQSLQSYAHASLESIMGPKKMWVKKSQIELWKLNEEPCAKTRISYEISKVGEMEGELYFFIKNQKGFHISYVATPSEFDKYRDEAMKIVQSIRFMKK